MSGEAGFPSWWSQVYPHLPGARRRAIDLIADRGPLSGLDEARLWHKSRRGWVEHGGAIRWMTPLDIMREAQAEVDDLMVYLAAEAAARADRP